MNNVATLTEHEQVAVRGLLQKIDAALEETQALATAGRALVPVGAPAEVLADFSARLTANTAEIADLIAGLNLCWTRAA